MIYQKNYDFSFSGLKTAVLYKVKSEKRKALDTKGTPRRVASEKYIRAMCAEIQQAIIDVLIFKTLKTAKEFNVRSIILGGGVTANEELRRRFKVQSLKSKVNFLVPPKNLCTDNAAMVAVAGYFHWPRKENKSRDEEIEANANLRL
jgi:N6-L-threonylcarbamoyladenine synthase